MYPAFSRITRLMIVVVVLSTTLIASIRINLVKAQETSTLLEDSFDDNSNGWEMASTNTKTVDMNVKKGELIFDVSSDKDGRWSFATPDKSFPNDVDVAVDVQAKNSSDAYWYAAVLMRSDQRTDSDSKSTEYYHFEITSKGEWGFALRHINKDTKKLEYKLLKSGKLSKFDPEESHNLAVSAKGTEFTYTVDGKKVGTFDDDTVNANDDPKYVGLLAGTLEGEQEATISFDNFIVQGQDTGSTDGQDGQNIDDSSVESGGILFKENFKDNKNGWPESTDDQSSIAVDTDNNALVIKVFEGTKDGWMRWAGADKLFSADVDVSVNAAVDDSESKGSWEYGLGVRYYSAKDKYFYYMLTITSDEQWFFSSHDADGFKTLKKGKLKDFDPTKSNKLNVIAKDNTFEFFFNNKKLGDVEDDSIEANKSYYVILSGTSDDKDSSVSVSFKNLLVLKP